MRKVDDGMMAAACAAKGHTFLRGVVVTRPSGVKQTLARFKCGGCGRESQNFWSKLTPYCRRCNPTTLKGRPAPEFAERLAQQGHTLLRVERCGRENKAVFRCGNCDGTSRAAFQDIASKFCKGCSPRFHSKNEGTLAELLGQMYPGLRLVRNDKKLLRSLGAEFKSIRELDIVMYRGDDVVLAVEWNGKHWHADPKVVAKDAAKAALLAARSIPFVAIEDPAGPNIDFVIDSFIERVVPLLGAPPGLQCVSGVTQN